MGWFICQCTVLFPERLQMEDQAMSLYASLHHIVTDWIAARRVAETEALLNAMPSDLRKDIGWPADGGRLYRPLSRARVVGQL